MPVRLVLNGIELLGQTALSTVWWIAKRAWKLMRGRREVGTLGREEFSDDKALKASGRLAPLGMWAMCTTSLKRVHCDREASLITIGQKGLGKTQSMIAMVRGIQDIEPVTIKVNGAEVKKQILPDLLVYDPKTGVLNATRKELEKTHTIFVIDIRDPDKSEMWCDPLSILDPTDGFDYDRQLDALARLISPEAMHGKHDHFDSYPRIMIAGTIKHCLSQKRYSLAQCVERLIVSKAEREKLFKEMEHSTDPIIRGAVEAFNSAGDREKGSFITTNFEKMKFWLRPSVRRITEGSGKWTVDDLKKIDWTWEKIFDNPKPIAIFIIGGLGTEEGSLVRLLVGNAINSARRRFNKTDSTPLKKPLWVLIDECKTLGHCDAIMHINRELREAGVNVAMWWLTYEDGKKTYPDWETLLSGCDKIVYGNSGDLEWYGKIEKELGKTTVQTRSESESDRSKGKGRHEASRNLMDAAELARLPFEECVGIFRSKDGVVKVRGRKPFSIDHKNKKVIFH